MFAKPFYNFMYSLGLVFLTAALGSYFNNFGMNNFYNDLTLSSFNPPNYIFPWVWTILYVLMIIAFDRILNNENKPLVKVAHQWFIGNLFLQVLWTYLFFYCGYFVVALVILVLLDLATVILVWQFYKIDRPAAWMMLPYLLWIIFATYLNWAIVDLNGIILTTA